MAYESVDAIQKLLAEGVFHHATDKKKAAGRSLGTIIELVTYYVLREWGFVPITTIELALPEFGNPSITHNVEFGLHPRVASKAFRVKGLEPPLTPKKLVKDQGIAALLDGFVLTSNQLLSTDFLQRNACVLGEHPATKRLAVANILALTEREVAVGISVLHPNPFAIVECKRVGVEEGAKKGPTTIEKAKQGAYVAKHVSSLQKVRAVDGTLYAAFAKPEGGFRLEPYDEALEKMIHEASAQRRSMPLLGRSSSQATTRRADRVE
jgi:hypothetical protein